ncbi:3-oxoacyl-[acyl-carrier protein] reductase [Richelia intracellularis]|nr:3-oxoacyl-[acyl-carrier protein] reductase [Richelia intracellularis]CDN12368.1 3-oxoacyl-[acyl-carrier protein] reductase [Richelia intracellularis]
MIKLQKPALLSIILFAAAFLQACSHSPAANGRDSFGSREYDLRIINDKSTTVVLTAKNVLDGIGL